MEIGTSVLVVGGGLSGLTTAALLAHQGVQCILVERHPDTSIQYKFAGISPRSMEIFRGLGLEEEIRAKRTGDQQGGGIAWGRTLNDPEIQWSGPAWADASGVSPTQPATCDQHVLEPIVRDCAERLGADVRFSTEFLDWTEDSGRLRARIRERETASEFIVAFDYLIAADGANGSIRETLGIARSGATALQHWMNMIFETDMLPTLDARRFTSCFVTDLNGTFTPREDGRWLLALQHFPDKGEREEDFDDARCRELVMRGAGRSDIKADLIDARSWQVSACVADRFDKGRVFLVGDAAHLMPPTGAFGGNSGIHDAHNLAWKIAMVTKGEARAELLDSYEVERRPVIKATLDQALARLQRWFRDPAQRLPPPVEVVHDYDVVLGQRYEKGALIPEGQPSDKAFEDFSSLSGKPGTRAPHLTVECDGRHVSTLDLFDRRFVLLSADETWAGAAEQLSRKLRSPVVHRPITDGGEPTSKEAVQAAYGIGRRGASLVRPDGFVAWRANETVANPAAKLSEVISKVGLATPGA